MLTTGIALCLEKRSLWLWIHQSQSLEAKQAETPPLSMWRRRRSTTLTALGGGFGQINTPAAAVADAILL